MLAATSDEQITVGECSDALFSVANEAAKKFGFYYKQLYYVNNKSVQVHEILKTAQSNINNYIDLHKLRDFVLLDVDSMKS